MRTVSVLDITADPTCRTLAKDLNAAGVRAVLATPVRIARHDVGVLNLYRAEACAWTKEDEAGPRRSPTS
jgi:GAF domain-containing protein